MPGSDLQNEKFLIKFAVHIFSVCFTSFLFCFIFSIHEYRICRYLSGSGWHNKTYRHRPIQPTEKKKLSHYGNIYLA